MMRYQRRCSITEQSFRLTIAAMKEQYAATSSGDEVNPSFAKIDHTTSTPAVASLNKHCLLDDDDVPGKIDLNPLFSAYPEWQTPIRDPRHDSDTNYSEYLSKKKSSLNTDVPGVEIKPGAIYDDNASSPSIEDSGRVTASSSVLECLERAVQVTVQVNKRTQPLKRPPPKPSITTKGEETYLGDRDKTQKKRRKFV